MTSVFDRLPSWRKNGPWPYELGVAALILWIAECVRNLEFTRARYGPVFALWDWVDDYPFLYVSLLWFIAALIIAGFGARYICPRCSVVMRVAGLASSGGIFGMFAFYLFDAFPWSIGGGAYLFLCWRAFAVAAAVTHRFRRLFRAPHNPPR